VKVFFDTSALLPVFLEDHEHHAASLRAFLKADKTNSCFGAHSLAELYSTATRLPGKHRLSGEQVMLFLDNVVDRLAMVSLTTAEYYQTVKAAAVNGIVGGTIYDLLLAQCALKADAQIIYTWNVKHFQQLGAGIAKLVRTPV
jgi:predicted nucleic acid-binding protein